MKPAILEHVNVTVTDPDRTAAELAQIFGWHVRWAGASLNGGRSVHVGEEGSYVALYTHSSTVKKERDAGQRTNGLNHIAVVVEDLDATEARVVEAGFTPYSHQDYEPGKRFYFFDRDEVEYEVVSYV